MTALFLLDHSVPCILDGGQVRAMINSGKCGEDYCLLPFSSDKFEAGAQLLFNLRFSHQGSVYCSVSFASLALDSQDEVVTCEQLEGTR